jgi:uncharacterized membrane protein YdjX (TVP38/TMEM64 family)
MKRGWTVAAVVGLALLLWAVWEREAITAWMSQARPVPFFALVALLTTVGAPITPFFIVAGATFGVRMGLIGSGLALAVSLVVTYWIAQGLRPWVESVLRRFDRELPDFERAGKSVLHFTLMVKLAPGIPAFLKNASLAVAGVPFPLYLGVSLLVTGAYVAALVVLGESLLEHDLRRSLALAAAFAVLIVLGLRLRGSRSPGARRSRRRVGNGSAT